MPTHHNGASVTSAPISQARSSCEGALRKLVLAFDIGTTHSSASYAILDPGLIPEIKSVVRFLNNRAVGNFKIPSVLFYDHDRTFRGVKGTVDDDEAEDLYQIRWWKLKVSSGELPATAKKYMTAELPEGKSIQDLFADFLRYLFDSVKAYIQESESNGEKIWESLKNNIDLILPHPNGWEGREQDFLRKSVVQASIFTEEEALSRVSFVTESEATFNFCAANTESGELLELGHKVILVEAGGGVIGVGSYIVNSTSPLGVEELYEPKCFYQGGEIVTARARAYAEARFKNSRFDNVQDLAAFTESFDTGLKTTFSDKSKPWFVKFGSLRDNDAACGVKGGKLSLQGSQVEKFFEPSINTVVECIEHIAARTNPEKPFVFIVGSFSETPWLFQEVGRRIAARGLKLSRPNAHTDRAVATGAISYYLARRTVRYTYGTLGPIEYDHSVPKHCERSHKKYLGITGEFHLDIFDPILFKGSWVPGMQEFRKKVVDISPLPPVAGRDLKFPVIRYTGTSKEPRWTDEEQGEFKTLYHISVDVSKAQCITGMSRIGFPSFKQDLELVYTFDQNELKLQLAWMEGGVEKRYVAVVCDE